MEPGGRTWLGGAVGRGCVWSGQNAVGAEKGVFQGVERCVVWGGGGGVISLGAWPGRGGMSVGGAMGEARGG